MNPDAESATRDKSAILGIEAEARLGKRRIAQNVPVESPSEAPILGIEAEAPLKLHRRSQPGRDDLGCAILGIEAEAPLKVSCAPRQ